VACYSVFSNMYTLTNFGLSLQLLRGCIWYCLI